MGGGGRGAADLVHGSRAAGAGEGEAAAAGASPWTVRLHFQLMRNSFHHTY